MANTFFEDIFGSSAVKSISVTDFLVCLGVALLLGIALALSYSFKTRYTRSFVFTLATIPAIVCVVIMMVNGSIGTGVAVAGAFSLVRFRSAPGSAKEIAAIFLAMVSGLICGVGYIGYAVLFTVIMCVVLVGYSALEMLFDSKGSAHKTLKITIPEDLDYTQVFEDIFEEYTSHTSLERVKTANMGSMFRLTYNVTLRNPSLEKEFIDKLRTRNGNLEIMVSRPETGSTEL